MGYLCTLMSNQQGTNTQAILTGNLWRVMLKMSLPAILGMTMFGLNNFIDAVFVGQFVGQQALAGMSLAFPLLQTIWGFGALVGTGAGGALSIAIGAKDHFSQQRLFGNMATLSLAAFLLVALPSYVWAYELITFIGGEGALLDVAVEYFRIIILGSIFTIFGIGSNMLIRAEGKMKQAMILGSIAVIGNLILNPIFIIVLGWGVTGAAWATNAAMLTYTLANYIYFYKGHATFDIDLRYVGLDRTLARTILSIGLPGLLMNLMSLAQQVAIFRSLAHYGSEADIAFFGAANRIILLLVMPIVGFTRAMQPVLGINYGAKQYQRVSKTYHIFTYSSILFTMPFWLYMGIFPENTMNMMLPGVVMTPNDLLNFRIYLLILPALPLAFNSVIALQSINRGKLSSIITVSRQLLLFVPVLLLVAYFYGVNGVYYGIAGSDLVLGLLAYVIVWRLLARLKNQQPDAPQANPNDNTPANKPVAANSAA